MIRPSDIIIIIMDDPLVLLTPMELQMSPDGDPRLLDTIFNVSSLTSGIFNNSLFQYAGAIIVGIILFGDLLVFLLVKLGSKSKRWVFSKANL